MKTVKPHQEKKKDKDNRFEEYYMNLRAVNKTRIKYLMGFLVLLLIEVLIALYIHDDFIRPYIGDVLVVMVLYCFIRIFIPTGVKLMPLYIFIFAVGVEILQLFRLVEVLGLENNRLLRVIIGSVFDVKDIICYGVGCILIMLVTSICSKVYV